MISPPFKMLFKLLITEFQNLHKPDGFPEKMSFLEFWTNGKFLSYVFSLNQEITKLMEQAKYTNYSLLMGQNICSVSFSEN